MWCFIGWHSWDNKEDGSYCPPQNRRRTCTKCKLKQEWKASTLWAILQTDAPMGTWQNPHQEVVVHTHIYTIKKEGERFRVDHTTNPSTARWISWHERLFDAKQQLPEDAYFVYGPVDEVLEIWWKNVESLGSESNEAWATNGF